MDIPERVVIDIIKCATQQSAYEEIKAKISLFLGVMLAVLGVVGGVYRLEPMHSQFLPFMIWSYTLLADNVLYRAKGISAAISSTSEFIALAVASFSVMCFLELLNLRLGVWYYINQPSGDILRWSGLGLTWASLLPCVCVTEEAICSFGVCDWTNNPHLILRHMFLDLMPYLGVGLFCLSMLLPGSLWPLGYLSLFLIVEPLNRRKGLPSFIRELEFGFPGRAARLAVAGLICGISWSAWNYIGGYQWMYSGGFAVGPEIFGLKMSVYLAFPVLALILYSLHGPVFFLHDRLLASENSPWSVKLGAAGLILIGFYATLRIVDAHTVRLYLGWV